MQIKLLVSRAEVLYQAKAFQRGVELHKPTVAALREHFKAKGRLQDLNEDRMRMATLPTGTYHLFFMQC